MKSSRAGRAIAWAFATACACAALAADAPAEFFPDGYRGWTVAKFKFLGPEHPNYDSQGGFRHHFANDAALASWGNFSDGAVIVDERVRVEHEQKVWVAREVAFVAVMRKDARNFADTGGWYFNLFTPPPDGRTPWTGMTPAATKAACFDACHRSQAARDFVFSDPRR